MKPRAMLEDHYLSRMGCPRDSGNLNALYDEKENNELQIQDLDLLLYLKDQTKWIAELEGKILAQQPEASNAAAINDNRHHNRLLILNFLRDLIARNQKVIQKHASSEIASSSPARVSFESDEKKSPSPRQTIQEEPSNAKTPFVLRDTAKTMNSANRVVHFDTEDSSQSNLLSSSDDDDEEETEPEMPPTVIASHRKRATGLYPNDGNSPNVRKSNRKTVVPPMQVHADAVSVVSEMEPTSPVRTSYHEGHEEGDAMSTETPFFDRFCVDYDPADPRKVIVRPNPRRSRRGKLKERYAVIDEHAPLQDLYSASRLRDRTSIFRGKVKEHTCDGISEGSRSAVKNTPTPSIASPKNVPNTAQMPQGEYTSTSRIRTPLTSLRRPKSPTMRSTKSLPSSFLLYAQAQIELHIPQIVPISKEEYDSAPRLVHFQVPYHALETIVDTLNRKIETTVTGRQETIKRMHMSETDLWMMCHDLFEDDTLCKNLISALCHFQRLWMRKPRVDGKAAVFDIILDEVLSKA